MATSQGLTSVIDTSGHVLTVFGSAAATVLLWEAVSAGEPLGASASATPG
jgi:hypothetical protein